MRIVFTVHKLPPESLGGTEVYTRGLARALATQGHEVTIFAPSPSVTEYTLVRDEDGVTRCLTPLPATRTTENPAAQFWHTFRDRSMERDFARLLVEKQPEVVHFQHVQGVSAHMIQQAADIPRVATLHDYWYFCANSQLIRPDRSVCAGPSPGARNCVDCATARADLQILRTLRPITALPLHYRNRVLANYASQLDLMVAPSAFLREQYVTQGFPADRIIVQENGLDWSRINNAPGAPPRKNYTGRPLRFGFLGTLAWMKGAHILVEAFNRIDPAAAMLDLYGSGSAFPEYAAEVRAAITNPSITLHPPAPYNEVGKVLADFDVLIVPSLWYENSPLVIQEAFAAGVPVIASNLGALGEKVEPGKSGWRFAPGDAADLANLLRRLIAAPQEIAALSATLPIPPNLNDQARALADIYANLQQ